MEELKKKEEQEKKKNEEEAKQKEKEANEARAKMVKVFSNLGKPKAEETKKTKKSGSVVRSRSKTGKTTKPLSYKKTLEEKVSGLLSKPVESAEVLKIYSKELTEFIKKEFLYPMVAQAIIHGDSVRLARKGQNLFENRPVIKHVYKWARD